MCEALLSVKYGPEIICHIVANQADCFLDGKSLTLIAGGGVNLTTEYGRVRSPTVGEVRTRDHLSYCG